MKPYLLLLLIFITPHSFAGENIEPFENSKLPRLFHRLTENNASVKRSLALSPDIEFITELAGTTKGNGTIKIHNLLLRIYDTHDDGIVYKNANLNIEVKDLNRDGVAEIILTGIINYSGEQETDPVRSEPLKTIYSLDCNTGLIREQVRLATYSPLIYHLPVEPVKCLKRISYLIWYT